MNSSNRILLNTSFLYIKMAFSVVISLYATRLILEALGASDYGIYVIIGGVISMLGFLNVSMTSSTQRHLSFSMGKGNLTEVRKVFANSILLHFILGAILVVLFELLGMYLLKEKLQIAPEKIETAKNLFHFVVMSTFVAIIAVPYDGIVNAKENMLFLAITGILDSILKLLIAFSLFLPFEDKLLTFGILMFSKELIMRIIKRFYCLRKYKQECNINIIKNYDYIIIRELYSFAGWNLLGVIAYMLRNQGVSVVLNLFFSTVINAAYGIANQVNSQLRLFSEAMMQAINPQMVKNEGSGDRNRVLFLTLISSRFSFFIFTIMAMPIFLELDFIINLWLLDVPDSTVVFCKLIIILTIIQQLRSGVTIATHAIGKIKEYQFFNAPVQLLSLPLGYSLLYLGYPAYSIILAVISIETIIVFLNILFFKKLTNFSPLLYIKEVLVNCLFSLGVSYLFLFSLKKYLFVSLYPGLRVLCMVTLSMLVYPCIIYFFSLKDDERKKIKSLLIQLKSKFKKNN